MKIIYPYEPSDLGADDDLVKVGLYGFESVSPNAVSFEPTETSFAVTAHPMYSRWLMRCPPTVGGFGVANIGAPRGYIRGLVKDTVAGTPTRTNKTPTSIQASSGVVSGDINSIDDTAISGAADYVQLSSGGYVRVRFNNTYSLGNPKPGTARQAFCITVSATTLNQPVRVSLFLYQNGGAIQSWDDYWITNDTTTPRIVIQPWDSTPLVGFNNVELQVQVEVAAGDVRIHSVEWIYEGVDDPPDYDSGWIALPDAGYYTSTNDPTVSAHHIMSSAYTVSDFDDPGDLEVELLVMPQFTSRQEALSAKRAYFTLPYVGTIAWGTVGSYDIQRGTLSTNIMVERRAGTTSAGQSYGADAFLRREVSFELNLTRAQRDEVMLEVDWRRGQTYPVYVVAEDDMSTLDLQRFTAFWGVMTKGGPAKYVDKGTIHSEDNPATLFRKAYTFTERL